MYKYALVLFACVCVCGCYCFPSFFSQLTEMLHIFLIPSKESSWISIDFIALCCAKHSGNQVYLQWIHQATAATGRQQQLQRQHISAPNAAHICNLIAIGIQSVRLIIITQSHIPYSMPYTIYYTCIVVWKTMHSTSERSTYTFRIRFSPKNLNMNARHAEYVARTRCWCIELWFSSTIFLDSIQNFVEQNEKHTSQTNFGLN